MKDRYSIGVGLVFLVLVVFVAIKTLGGGSGEETLGLDKLDARWPLPEFAVPAAAGSLEGDGNVAQDDCGSAGIPCPEDPPRKPACRLAAHLRLLRQAAGALVLVQRRRRLRRPTGRGRARLPALP
jgi:hypothetical protein